MITLTKIEWKNWIFRTTNSLLLLVAITISSCEMVYQEELGACLEWGTSTRSVKDPLPYPMTGYIERIETHTVCIDREEKHERLAL